MKPVCFVFALTVCASVSFGSVIVFPISKVNICIFPSCIVLQFVSLIASLLCCHHITFCNSVIYLNNKIGKEASQDITITLKSKLLSISVKEELLSPFSTVPLFVPTDSHTSHSKSN